jgi:opacity protein-like surface antigen
MRSLLVVWGVVFAALLACAEAPDAGDAATETEESDGAGDGDAGKAVFHVEYVDDSAHGSALADSTSPVTLPLGFSSLIKTWELDAWRIACG